MRRQLVVCFISGSTHKQRRHEPSVNLGPGVEVIPMLHLIARAILYSIARAILDHDVLGLAEKKPPRLAMRRSGLVF
jgi:hypothetical protein